MDVATYRNAMARLGGAVSIISTDGPSGRHGFTASAVCSVTDTPPTLLVCMNSQSRQRSGFEENGVLCVNVLRGDHQHLSGIFANKHLDMEQRFLATKWSTGHSGAPTMDEALVCFDCRISEIHSVGSHSIFYCQVLNIDSAQYPEGLIYFDRAYHRIAVASQPAA